MIYVCDNKRHLICVPYSISNLHIMALELNIDKGNFNKNHYVIPEKRIKEIEKKCQIITLIEIKEIIQQPKYAKTILAEEMKWGVAPPDFFLKTYLEYHGYNYKRR